MKAFNWIKKELGTLILLVIAVILCAILYPIGIFWSLILKPLYHLFKGDYTKANKGLRKYFANFFYQLWNIVKLCFYFIAELLDIGGNLFCGEGIEDAITPMEDTMLGNGTNTISVGIGDIEEKAKLDPSKMNDRGHWIVNQLNKFESNHCNKAIRRWRFNEKLKAEG